LKKTARGAGAEKIQGEEPFVVRVVRRPILYRMDFEERVVEVFSIRRGEYARGRRS